MSPLEFEITRVNCILLRLAFWVKFSADDILKYFFFSFGDNLHEMSSPVFGKTVRNITSIRRLLN